MDRLYILITLSLIFSCDSSINNLQHPDTFESTPKKSLGKTLIVFLDGRQTLPLEGDSNDRWTVEPVSGNPTVRFQTDPQEFELPLKSVNITIYPIIDGEIDEMVLYRPIKILYQPDQDIRLNSFEYVGRNQYRTVTTLPPGQYRFVLHLIGKQNRDRQVILLTVK